MTLRQRFYFFAMGCAIGLPTAWTSILWIRVIGVDAAQAIGAAGAICFWTSAIALSMTYCKMRKLGQC
jgi:hypothetical protein